MRRPDARHLVFSSTGRNTPTLWRDDCVEAYLHPGDADPACAAHLAINPAGAVYAGIAGKEHPAPWEDYSPLFDPMRLSDITWDPPLRVRARRHAGGWTAEIALPLASLCLNGTSTVPPVWRANFARLRQGREGALAEDTAWQPTGSLRPFIPERLGTLQLMAGGQPVEEPRASAGTDLLAVLRTPRAIRDALLARFGCPAAFVPFEPAQRAEPWPGLVGGPLTAAAPLFLAPLFDGADREPPRTEMRIRHDGERLLFDVRCLEFQGMAAVAEPRPNGAGLWKDDSIEVFLSPNRRASSDYVQVLVNAAGSLAVHRGLQRVPDFGISAVVQPKEDGWHLRVAVPFSAFSLTRKAVPALWGCNFFRNRAARPGTLALSSGWSKPKGWSRHAPEGFGTLWLERAAALPAFDEGIAILKEAADPNL